ncbi:MAG: UGSC family (seleno)protein, partial [Chloroflexota bacterium]
MRASVVAEKAGVRTVSIVASGFVPQARSVARSLGVENLPIAEYPGVIMTDTPAEFQRKVDALVDQIVEGMATPLKATARVTEPGPKDVVFRGTLDAVQDFFAGKQWTDGMPVIPPTVQRVERFLKFTDRSPDEVIGTLLPEKRQLTVWNVAVNGVMAGCRPEYMPVLLSVAEAIVEPEFRIEDAGSTPGWEPLIILNGPIVKELDFNYGSGAMRMGRRANTSVGRFLRLLFTNVAGVRIPPGMTDKGSFGISFNVVLAENEDAVAQLGWQPFSVDRGFRRGDNVVTVQSVVA